MLRFYSQNIPQCLETDDSHSLLVYRSPLAACKVFLPGHLLFIEHSCSLFIEMEPGWCSGWHASLLVMCLSPSQGGDVNNCLDFEVKQGSLLSGGRGLDFEVNKWDGCLGLTSWFGCPLPHSCPSMLIFLFGDTDARQISGSGALLTPHASDPGILRMKNKGTSSDVFWLLFI